MNRLQDQVALVTGSSVESVRRLRSSSQQKARASWCNCIAPETILTESNMRNISEEIREQLRETHPIRRLGTPDDVARAALFLASTDASWISESSSTSPGDPSPSSYLGVMTGDIS
jgi:NAD(P)-dependent dehydrogenase (short-subunit alcohol dehydrogenase family)